MLNETIVTAAEMTTELAPEQSNVVVDNTPASTGDTVMGIGMDKLKNAGLFGVGVVVGIGAAWAHKQYKCWKAGKEAQAKAQAKEVVAAVKETAAAAAKEAVAQPPQAQTAEQPAEQPAEQAAK